MAMAMLVSAAHAHQSEMNAVWSASMVMNIAHQLTDVRPDRYRGRCSPRPTAFSSFSGVTDVPVHSQ